MSERIEAHHSGGPTDHLVARAPESSLSPACLPVLVTQGVSHVFPLDAIGGLQDWRFDAQRFPNYEAGQLCVLPFSLRDVASDFKTIRLLLLQMMTALLQSTTTLKLIQGM